MTALRPLLLVLIIVGLVASVSCQKRLPRKEDEKKEEAKKNQTAPAAQYGSATLKFLSAKAVGTTGDQAGGDPTAPGDTPPTDPAPAPGEPTSDPGDKPTDPTEDPGDKPSDPTDDPGQGNPGIPPEVKLLKVKISGEGIAEPITKDFALDGKTDEFSIEKIPAGKQRKFEIEAVGAEDKVLFAGEGSADIEPNKANEVQIAMKKVGEDPQPTEGSATMIILWPQD